MNLNILPQNILIKVIDGKNVKNANLNKNLVYKILQIVLIVNK